MAINHEGAKQAFIKIDDAYKLARNGNTQGYKNAMGEAFAILADGTFQNQEYVGAFLEPLFEGIDKAVTNANKPGLAAQTDSMLLEAHGKAQGALLTPYIGKYGEAEITDELKKEILPKQNLQKIIEELSNAENH